ncbi:hypothetical protein [Parasutterella muris]|uniref:hypothetical protein n=1 Tax=Parasutterella muris TaxID=2565572 RepID=UPI0020422F5D|nr:hypothetical protein [Parasutterella muris]
MANSDTPRGREYNRIRDAKPENIKKRVLRNKARRHAIAAGLVSKGDDRDVDHIRPLSAGGSGADSNTRVIDRHRNRGWRKGQSGYKAKKV